MKTKKEEVVPYEAPAIELVDIRLDQHILANGSGTGDSNLNDMPGEYW